MTAALVILTAAIWIAAGLFLARGFGVANRPAPPSDPACPCPDPTCDGSAYDAIGRPRKAGEWLAESRTRGGRP